ncbi:MAG: dTDP-4-dehydrorhamnose 3,5-epimerase [Epsilonproteobacteria bacterium]|nr:MAG: dTDP-4-dehydrorhamnose 3,5-epimerase [Campylobacterota bacterium]
MGNKLNIVKTSIEDVFILEPNSHVDSRGSFSRIFCQDELKEVLKENSIKQVNHSVTYKKGSVRGMHFQYAPDCEIKLLKCIRGSIVDFIVDIRENSSTFLQTFQIELSAKNQKILYIPKGFAHGFQTLEDNTELIYFHTSFYTPDNESALNVKDPLLNIKLPLAITDISQRDREHSLLEMNFKGIKV